MVAMRIGKRAAGVAKEFALRKVFGDRSTINGDERAYGAAGSADEWNGRTPPCRCQSLR